MSKVAKVACPVCAKPFNPKGGLQGHLTSSKDSAHAAHRAAKAQATAQAPPEPQPLAEPANPAPQQEAKAHGEGPVQVTFTPAVAGGPLLPEDKPQAPAPVKGTNPAAAVQAIPKGQLAQVINGGTAAMCNGFFLRGKGDGQVTPDEVASTRFGESAEAAVRLYFPNLPWDHPAVLLFVSAAGLAVVVARKKAPKEPKGKAKDAQKAVPAKVDAPAEPEPTPPADSDAPAPVDDYWSGIVTQAGGPPKADLEVEA